MIERPEEGGFTPEAVLSAHRERTLKRMRGAETALLIQDGTDLNFATRGGCSGLGVISRTKGAAGTLGIHMHSTFAVNGNGLPLGVPRVEFDCPDGKADKGKPPEERKSARWLRGWRATPELPAENLFAKSEIAMLLDYAHHMGFSLPCQANPGEMPELDAVSLGEAVLLVARLGGYLNRKNDGPPGHQLVWEGYARMSSGAQTLERAARIGDDSALHKLIAQLKND